MQIDQLERVLDLIFNNKNMVIRALTHSSLSSSVKESIFERMELLGDSVLAYYITDFLLDKYPEATEGEISTMRDALVCEEILCKCSLNLCLANYFSYDLLSFEKDSLMGSFYEVIIGIIYKDLGIEFAKKFINKTLLTKKLTPFVIKIMQEQQAKGYLQEICLKRFKELPLYKNRGRDPYFSVVYCSGRFLGKASSLISMKKASSLAALAALDYIRRNYKAST
jgi:dsRNA-specific ribonuclease